MQPATPAHCSQHNPALYQGFVKLILQDTGFGFLALGIERPDHLIEGQDDFGWPLLLCGL